MVLTPAPLVRSQRVVLIRAGFWVESGLAVLFRLCILTQLEKKITLIDGLMDHRHHGPHSLTHSLTRSRLFQVYNRLEALGLWDRTVMIVLSDHGREECAGRDHGGFSDAEVNTQWLAVGAGIRHGQTLAHSLVSIEDTAPTVLWALNLTWPMQWRGRPVWEAFEGAESGSEWWWYRSPQVPVQDRSRPACFQEDLRAHAPFLSTPCELWKPGGALRVDTAFTVEGVPYLVSDGAIWSLDPASGALFPASRSMNELVDGNVSSTFTCNGSLHFSLIDGRNLREGSKGPVPAPDLDGFGAVDAALEHPNETASVLLFKGKDIWLYSCTQGSLTLLNSTLPFNLMGVQAALSHRQTLYLFAGMQVCKTAPVPSACVCVQASKLQGIACPPFTQARGQTRKKSVCGDAFAHSVKFLYHPANTGHCAV